MGVMGHFHQRELDFYFEAKEAFEENERLETYTNNDEEYIALRYGEDRDCIKIYELDGQVAFFHNVMPTARKIGFLDDNEKLKMKLDYYHDALKHSLTILKRIEEEGDNESQKSAWDALTHEEYLRVEHNKKIYQMEAKS